jgi:spore germination protein YaaH
MIGVFMSSSDQFQTNSASTFEILSISDFLLDPLAKLTAQSQREGFENKFKKMTRMLWRGSKSILMVAAALPLLSFSSQANAAPFVLAYTHGQLSQAYPNLQAFYSNVSAIGIGTTYSLLGTGAVSAEGMTTTTQNIITFAKSKQIPLYPTVSDYSNAYGGFDPSITKSIVNNTSFKNTAVANLVNLAKSNSFAGIDLDVEAVQPADKIAFTSFVTALSASLHANGLKLIISVPAKIGETTSSWLDGFDYLALGQQVDYFQLMTYDETGPGWSSSIGNGYTWPGPESGVDWQKLTLSYALTKVPAAKLLSGLPAYGYDYSTATAIDWSAYARTIASHGATTSVDATSATPYATWGPVNRIPDGTAWSANTKQPVIWFDDAQSIKAKAALVGLYGLGGTSVWAIGQEDASFWSSVQSGLQNGAATNVTLTATAGSGGAITPSGNVSVIQGTNQAFTIMPNAGYSISAVTVDGAAVGNVSSYALYNVQAAHNVTASFIASPNQVDKNIERLGVGYIWAKNSRALTDTNKLANVGINDGDLTKGIIINPNGEGGLAKWEAAGVIWPDAKSISTIKFTNSALDSYGNGYFQSNVSLQFTTNGTTWFESGWKLNSPYPYTAQASNGTFIFTGPITSGVRGIRISGKTGSSSWSGGVNEVQVLGH